MNDLHPPLRPLIRALPDLQRDMLRAALLGSALVVAASVALVGLDAVIWLALAGYALATALVLALMRRGYPHDRLGLCNLVTLARLALAAALLTPLAGAAAPWAVLAVAVIALSLDGIDGWLARRDGLSSEFGARFDMEVDSALALILALNAWAAGTAGVIVLLIGLPRYVFAAAGTVFPWLHGALPDRYSRKVICVVQIATLIALQVPPVAAHLANPVVAAVAAALVWSFGRDVVWLWRART